MRNTVTASAISHNIFMHRSHSTSRILALNLVIGSLQWQFPIASRLYLQLGRSVHETPFSVVVFDAWQSQMVCLPRVTGHMLMIVPDP